MSRKSCTEPQCLYNGALYLYLYLYCPYGPYSLYRATVPVQRCTLPLPITLLPLWAVRPVQSHSDCKRVNFIFTFTTTTIITSYLLTYSMVQSPCSEANWFATSQEFPRISRKPKVHYRNHNRPHCYH